MAELTHRMADQARLAIQTTQIVNRLQDHFRGDKGVDLSQTQVAAAKILLAKVLPDSQSIDVTAHSLPESVTEEVLLARLRDLIESNPQLINDIRGHSGAYALPAPVPMTGINASGTGVADIPNGAVLDDTGGREPGSPA